MVELAGTTARHGRAPIMVEQREGGVRGVVTAGRLLEVMVDAAVGKTPR